ncbi:MAG: N-acetylornithine carbamoyltransferase [Candidatus Lokiarchaeota archaeon]|nr:N-acetylornithine carbamoyltransferase [Candidatus Lokiarchaeota archaeon]
MPTTSEHERNFISTRDWNKADLDRLLNLAKDMKQNPSKYRNALDGKSLCMFFYNPSTRTRNSTEIAAYQLGMHPTFNSIKDSWVGYNSESIKDTAIVLSRYFDAIGIRIFPVAVDWKYKEGNRILREFAKWSTVPIINFEDDQYHPLQALNDIFTIKEKKEKSEGKKIVISWAYHPKPLPLSVPNSTVLATTLYGMDVTLAHPKNFELDDEIMLAAKNNAKKSGGTLTISHDIEEAYQDADVIYAKSWGSIQQYGKPKEEKALRTPYRDEWCVSEKHMALTKPDSVFMHCLPIRRNIVAKDEVVDGKHSIVYDQAENRLYTVKALLYDLLSSTM